MARVTMTFLLSRPFKTREEGRSLLRIFFHHFPRHVPEHYGNAINPKEKDRFRFDPSNWEPVLEKWNWRRFGLDAKDPFLHFHMIPVVRAPEPHHRAIFIHPLEAALDAVRAFLYEATNLLSADYVAAQVLTLTGYKEELKLRQQIYAERHKRYMAQRKLRVRHFRPIEQRIKPRAQPIQKSNPLVENWETMWMHDTPMLNIQPNHLKRVIYDLYWFTAFGPPYLEMFGRERILSTPAYNICELPYGGIAMELTDGIEDTLESWRSFYDRRTRAKIHLDCNAFFDYGQPRGHVYNVPKFYFDPDMYSE